MIIIVLLCGLVPYAFPQRKIKFGAADFRYPRRKG